MKEYKDMTVKEAKIIDMLVNEVRRLSHEYNEAQIEYEKYLRDEESTYYEGEQILEHCDARLYCMLDEMDTLIRTAKQFGVYK